MCPDGKLDLPVSKRSLSRRLDKPPPPPLPNADVMPSLNTRYTTGSSRVPAFTAAGAAVVPKAQLQSCSEVARQCFEELDSSAAAPSTVAGRPLVRGPPSLNHPETRRRFPGTLWDRGRMGGSRSRARLRRRHLSESSNGGQSLAARKDVFPLSSLQPMPSPHSEYVHDDMQSCNCTAAVLLL